jgi:CheY-like chemotaxis protein
MCRALILDSDQRERRFVAAIASTRCDKVEEVSTMRAAARALKRKRRHPNVVVATVEGIWKDRRNIPELLRASGVRIPFVLIVAKAAEALISEVRELGLRNLVHRPLRSEDLARALREATDSGPSPPAGAPPLTEEERHSNLSDLVDHFNATMKCPVGKGQVFLHSFIADRGRKTEPRVTLRCPRPMNAQRFALSQPRVASTFPSWNTSSAG